MKKYDKGSIVRTIALIIALINQILMTTGFNPIPGDYNGWYEVITLTMTFGASALAWWRNNFISSKGLEQKKVLKEHGLIDVE